MNKDYLWPIKKIQEYEGDFRNTDSLPVLGLIEKHCSFNAKESKLYVVTGIDSNQRRTIVTSDLLEGEV
jgi:hypothetical protein